MAKVFLTGIEASIANGLRRALEIEKHQIEHRPSNAPVDDFLDADIVFAGGDRKQYLTLLQGIRQARPALPFIVVTRIPETSEWLDALEAGATDYCSAPLEVRQVTWLMEPVLRHVRSATA
jgi:DNA-binding response OmpR family regulator